MGPTPSRRRGAFHSDTVGFSYGGGQEVGPGIVTLSAGPLTSGPRRLSRSVPRIPRFSDSSRTLTSLP